MAKRNEYDGPCGVCGVNVRANEGIVERIATTSRYHILCAEHAPQGSLDPPKPPQASKLPSIHLGEERYER